MPIHPTAIIDPKAEVDPGCDIGPYCVIGPDVKIGPGNRIGPYTVIEGPTEIGPDNSIGPHCSFGGPPQDLSYNGEPTRLVIGKGNRFADYVQLSRGSTKTEHQTTRIGDGNFLMAYSHVGHDSVVGDNNILANAVQLAGHVTVEDKVVFGGIVAIHQHCRVGRMAMVSGGSVTSLDIPPFCRVGGYGCAVFGLNTVGLERSGVSRPNVKRLREAYKLLFRGSETTESVLKVLETEFADSAEAQHWVNFFRSSKRGVVRERGLK
jgi:UDP-N-acetylglucosamine acyltransferase